MANAEKSRRNPTGFFFDFPPFYVCYYLTMMALETVTRIENKVTCNRRYFSLLLFLSVASDGRWYWLLMICLPVGVFWEG
jgi:hypothetical protein